LQERYCASHGYLGNKVIGAGIDEYFAESMRAMAEQNNHCDYWPNATRERLRDVDPTMYSIIERIWERRLHK
jgi:hypothetical protein